jgi:peptidoglycan/LPS O-acetylase OafA/YrhL
MTTLRIVLIAAAAAALIDISEAQLLGVARAPTEWQPLLILTGLVAGGLVVALLRLTRTRSRALLAAGAVLLLVVADAALGFLPTGGMAQSPLTWALVGALLTAAALSPGRISPVA